MGRQRGGEVMPPIVRDRRSCRALLVPAELAILTAIDEIEKLGVDERLVAANLALQQARNHLADFVDGLCAGEGR